MRPYRARFRGQGTSPRSPRHLRHVLLSYMSYYNSTRTHLSLNKNAPMSRAAETAGRIIWHPILGGRIINIPGFDLR